MLGKFQFMIYKPKGYLIFVFLFLCLIGLNGQETSHGKQSKSISINLDLYRLVSYEEGSPLQFGISINNVIIDRISIEFDYYCKKEIRLEPYYQILDINFTHGRKIPFLNRRIFYIKGGYLMRNIYLSGLPGRMNNIYSYEERSIYKIGIGASMSFGLDISEKIFMESNFKMGYCILGESDQFYGGEFSGFTDQDTNPFFALDILKLGYKFGG